jgi:uncharacterized membrane protein (UPF0127 family)
VKRKLAALVLVAAALVACSDDGSNDGAEASTSPTEDGATAPAGAPAFTPATILIDGAKEGTVLLQGEVADTDESRGFGLTGRSSLPDDYGMAFILFEEDDCCFWMRDTLIPLSIAFFDTDGYIVHMEDMEPCPADAADDECELYGSDEPYVGALEVKQGLFEEWGVSEGDRIRIVQ